VDGAPGFPVTGCSTGEDIAGIADIGDKIIITSKQVLLHEIYIIYGAGPLS
jgi:hypothetical protein